MNGFMTFLEICFQGDWAQRMGWTLLHSLWQIAALAGVYAAAALLLRNRSASSRYVVGCVAMLAMLVLPMLTYVLVPRDAAPIADAGVRRAPAAAMPPIESAESPVWEGNLTEPEVVAVEPSVTPLVSMASEPGVAPDAGDTLLADLSSSLRPYLPWATAAWLAGVLLLSLRPVWGWLHVRRLQRHGLSPLTDPVRHVCSDLMRRLGVNRAVRFAQSALVEVPTVVGYLRPLVLLPASAITGLNSSQLELILAHELAHVRRHDYVVNLAQTVIEALLFYHPGMWWVSSRIRCERENCCDDSAVALSGSRASYVQALARLEEERWATPAAVLAASGGSLLTRVRRLRGQPSGEFGYRNATAWLAGLVTIGMVAAAIAMQMPAEFPVDWEDVAQAEGVVQAIKARMRDEERSKQPHALNKNDKPSVEHAPNAFFTARVVDAETGKSIEKFTALAGTGRMEDIGWQWQPHTIHEFAKGQMQWPPMGDRGYKEQVLRVEAKGYVPYQTPPVKRLNQGELPDVAGWEQVPGGDATPRIISGRIGEPFELVIRLERDPSVEGRAVLPNGQPAVGAQVGIAMARREVRIVDGKIDVRPLAENARLRDRWSRPFMTTTDEQGRYTLPTEIAPAAVIITHTEGIAAFKYVDFPSSGDIPLVPWGAIDGRVMWGDEPGVEAKLDIGARTYVAKQFQLIVGCRQSVVTDDQGRFRVEKLPPGLAQVSHVIEVPGKEGSAYRPVQFIEISASEPTKMVFGGRGRPVVGKLVGAGSYEGVRIRIAPNAPYPGFLGDPNDVVWPAYGQFLNSKAGKNYVKGGIKPNADGTFRIENVPPETYQLFVTATGADGKADNVGYAKFTIDTTPGGASDEPHAVGEIKVK